MGLARHRYMVWLSASMIVLLSGKLVSADVVISEFMAINDTSLQDEDNERSDWIEIHNASATSVNLDGWYLTDQTNDLTRWSFPVTTLAAGGYMIVFASGKNRHVSGSELHTDFKLDGDGEYLALVRPDGRTVASQFSPAFPAQYADTSYGLSTTAVYSELIGTGDLCRVIVPTGAALGTNWLAPSGFDDSSWREGPTGVGFDTRHVYDYLIGTDIQSEMFTVNGGAYVRVPFVVPSGISYDSLLLDMKVKDGFAAYVNGVRVASLNAPSPLAWDSMATSKREKGDGERSLLFPVDASSVSLREGTNVLAIHALNEVQGESGRDADCLVLPLLSGGVAAFDFSGERRYFAAPTPGRINSSGYSGVAGGVQFSRSGGTATSSFMLALTTDLPEATIYYTLDRSLPSQASLVYTTPFTIADTTMVRARAYVPGMSVGTVRSETFLFLDPNVQAFNSDIPILLIDSFGYNIDSEDNSSIAYPPRQVYAVFIETNATGRTRITDIPQESSRGGMFVRGSSTSGNPKHPYGFEAWDEYDADKDISPLNMPEESDWVFYPPIRFDRALIRNPFVYRLSRQMGCYSSRTRYCEVFYNSDGGGLTTNDYRGVYVLEEKIKRDKNRVDVAKLDATDVTEPEITGGYVLKCDRLDPSDSGFKTTRGIPAVACCFVDPGEQEIEALPDQYNWIKNHVQEMEDALYATDFVNPTTGKHYTEYLDRRAWVDFNILEMLTMNVDALVLSTYFHKDRGGKIAFGPHWDFDRSMSCANDGRDDVFAQWHPGGRAAPWFFSHEWWGQLFRDSDAWQLYIDRWQHFRGGVLSESNIAAVIAEEASLVAEAQVREFRRWTNAADQPRPAAYGAMLDGTWEGELAHMQWWLTNRLTWVDSHFIDPPVFGQPGGTVPPGYALVLTAPSGTTIYYTLDGTDPRDPGGSASASARSLMPGASVTIERNLIIRARATDGSTFNSAPDDCPWSGLSEAIYSVSEPTLVVTEVMYHPRLPAGSETNGGYAPRHFEFVEIRNLGADAVELVGVRFTNGITFDFTYSDVRALDPGECAVVVDELAAFALRYPGWRGMRIAGEFGGDLDDGGERVELLSATGRVLSSFRYGDARGWPLSADGAGHSLVPLRLLDQDSGTLDYGRHWRASAYIDGSPGVDDPVPMPAVALNEFMAHTDYTGGQAWQDSDDWIELYNGSDARVDLGGWYLSDDPSVLTKWEIPASNSVPAGGWIAFSEVLHFHTSQTSGFGLNKAGEEIYLSHLPASGPGRVVDCVRFKGQENGISLGRCPDGGEFWFALEPTKGTANASPGLHVTVDELMYHPAATSTHPQNNTNDEYIEIRNPHAYDVPLWTTAGPWRVDGGVAFVFPSNTVLSAGNRLVLVGFDPATNAAALAAFTESYGPLPPEAVVLGPYDRALDNTGERVAIERPQLGDLPGEDVSWVIVDEVIYFDQAPWSPRADGAGDSLERLDEPGSGSDPDQWGVWAASPGRGPAGIYLHGIVDRAAYFSPVAVHMTVDASGIDAAVTHVDFFVETNRWCRDTSAPFECPLMGLTNAGRYACVAVAATAGGNHTSQTVRVDVLTLAKVSVADVSDFAVTAVGALQGPGAAHVQVCWGTTDGATDVQAWEHVYTVGIVSNAPFSAPLSGLAPGRTYYARVLGRTGLEEGWSVATTVFQSKTLTDWSARMRISFDGYGGTSVLTNFPVLVRLGTHIDGFSYADFGSPRGYDLRLMDGTLETALSYDIESWDTNGVSCVWVRVPVLTTHTLIWAYWGAGGIVSPPPYALDGSTWLQGFRAVWHLHDGLVDAAGARIGATDFGSVSTNGVVGLGRRFDGTSAYVVPGLSAKWYEEHQQGLTVSFWAFPSVIQLGAAFGTDSGMGDGKLFTRGYVARGKMYWRFGVGASEGRTVEPTPALQWQHVALVLGDGVARGVYNGGVPVILGTDESFALDGQPFLGAGNVGGVAGDFFGGDVDELRISEVPRSGDWLLAEYQTVAEPDTFAAYAVVPTQPTDLDHDGMADGWEDRHFGGTDVMAGAAGADWDSDGALNVDEYVAGTDPTNAASRFRLDIVPFGNGVRLSFDSLMTTGDAYYSGLTRYYDLQEAWTLTNNAWHGVEGYTNMRGDGTTVVHTNGAGRGYFRGRTRLE